MNNLVCFNEGLIEENPLIMLVLGICSKLTISLVLIFSIVVVLLIVGNYIIVNY